MGVIGRLGHFAVLPGGDRDFRMSLRNKEVGGSCCREAQGLAAPPCVAGSSVERDSAFRGREQESLGVRAPPGFLCLSLACVPGHWQT